MINNEDKNSKRVENFGIMKDYSNHTFGRWTAIKEVERNKHNQRQYLCRCECGTEKIVILAALTSGKSRSCGCLPPPKMDLVGQKYGRLTVLKEVEKKGNKRRFLCRCDCGNTTIVPMSSLRNSSVQSCGCLKKERARELKSKDLTGKRFGRLTAIKMVDKDQKKNINLWLCRCDCGNEVIVRTSGLLSGDTQSCGGIKKEQEIKNLIDMRNKYTIDGVVAYHLTAKLSKRNTSGHKGVGWAKREQKWRAYIAIKGKTIHLGYFDNKEDAIQARKKAEMKYHKPYLNGIRKFGKKKMV